jgi:DNA-binding beta-propeller fold protein YncE
MMRRTAALLALFFVFASCAQMPREETPELYWPFPPEKPRIKLVDVIIGSIDVTGVRSGKIKQVVFGEEREVGFTKPVFVAVKNDVMYVTDLNQIHIYDFGKKKFTAVVGGLGNATGIAAASDGTVFVADSAKGQVFILRPGKASMVPVEGDDYFTSPGGLAVDDANGRLIVPDAKRHDVTVFGLDGKRLFSFGRRGEKPGEFNFPYAAAVDREGRIYVVDAGNFRIQVFDRDGKFFRAFGSIGTYPGQFSRPKGIAVSSEGHIYVVDSAFGNFQIFDIDGNTLLAVGSNGSDAGKFILPTGIAMDENDRIYVVDQINKRVQVFQYLKEQD